MKNIYKNLALGAFLTVAAAVMPTYAQDACADIDANTALYNKYIANYDKAIAQRKIAVEAGKEYIQKYEACTTTTKDAAGAETKTATFADQIKYFKESVPVLEEGILKEEKEARLRKIYDQFNAAAKAQNAAEILKNGKEILAENPAEQLDITIVMASAAFDEVIKNPTGSAYSADTITYAKKAIDLINSGKTSKGFGVLGYQLKNKTNALGILNYSIGFAMVNDPAQKKDAAVYFYKSSQNESVFKNNPLLYQAIGANYLDEFIVLDKKRKEIIAANNNENNPESLEIEGMQRGYAERAIEAYARAYKSAKADPKQKKEYVDTLSSRVKDLYAFRNDGKAVENLDTYVTTVSSKPLTEPTTTVAPIKVETPAPAGTTPPTSGTTTPATTTPATTKPATTTPAKPVSSTTPPAAATDGTTATTTKAKAKKPAPKKKGTR